MWRHVDAESVSKCSSPEETVALPPCKIVLQRGSIPLRKHPDNLKQDFWGVRLFFWKSVWFPSRIFEKQGITSIQVVL